MRLHRLANIITRRPALDKIGRDLGDAEVIPPQGVERELVAHQIIGERGATGIAVDDAQRPVADAVETHAEVAGQQPVRAARELEGAESDGQRHQEDGLATAAAVTVRSGGVGRVQARVVAARQGRHLDHRGARHLRRDQREEPVPLLYAPPFRLGDMAELPRFIASRVSYLALSGR